VREEGKDCKKTFRVDHKVSKYGNGRALENIAYANSDGPPSLAESLSINQCVLMPFNDKPRLIIVNNVV